MKRFFSLAALVTLLVLGSSLPNPASAQPAEPYYDNDREVSYQTFYDELSPHGRWVEYPGTGYVWVPDAGPDFRPYSTNGHWVWTEDYEWMWVSDYDWGWAPFHYGRWDQDPHYGWYWVPGYEWSPAWVAWRDGGEYYGWAPLRPGININVNFNIGGYAPPVDFWCFAPRRYINSPRIHDYYVDRRRNVTIINFTTIIVNNYRYSNNYGFRSGPRRYDAERYCGSINPVRFRQSNQPGRSVFRNNEISVFRPNVRRDNNNRTIAPRNFERYDRNNTGNTRRNDNNGFNNGNNRSNETVRNNRDGNNRFDRNGNQPGPGNTNRDGNTRRFERGDNNGTTTPPVRQPENPNRNRNNQRFERNDNNGGYNTPPVRQPETRRPETRRPETRRNDENIPNRNRDQGVTRPAPVPDRNMNTGNNDRRFERRNDNGGYTSPPVRTQPAERQPAQRPQVERRTETRQQQPRQFERRENNSRQPANTGGNGERNGRKRF